MHDYPTSCRYYAAAMQTSLPALKKREDVPARVEQLVKMAEGTLAGYAPFHDVRLFVFPEFAHCAPMYTTVKELLEHTALRPDDVIAPYLRFCKQNGVYVQTGSFIEQDPKYPGAVFNATLLIGPDGVLSKYRKVNPWIPWEVHASPHDIPGYSEPLFPVVDTEIGKLGCAICYDWLFPEAIRQLTANGAEVLIRVSAYMDPWGAQAPMDWWTLSSIARARWRTRRMWWQRIKLRMCRTIRPSVGRVEAWWLISTAAFLRKRSLVRSRRW